jgi:hypothetical protein
VLLGFAITVRATPQSYTWDFGDGTVRTTTHPGGPFSSGGSTAPSDLYPSGVIGHPYPKLGTYTPTLTTTWSGEYLIAGTTTWLPVDGTATTTTAYPAVTVYESRTHLVEDDCLDNPDGPGCG